MAAKYQLRLKNQAGAQIAITDHFLGLGYTKRVNAPGAFSLDIGEADLFIADLALDYQVEIYRRDQAGGVDWYLDFEGLVRDITLQRTERGQAIATVAGVGYIDLLARRIVAGYAGTTYTDKSGPAETIAKEFVDEQCVTAPPARVIPGLSIEADLARGPTLQLARSFRNLLDVLQEICLMAEQKADPGDWAVVGTGPGLFEFRWFDGQLGDDKTWGNGAGNPPIIFSISLGNMARPVYKVARMDEANSVYVGGQGEGTGRTVEIRSDAGAIADSPWNRREVFADARNEETVPGLQDKGDRVLEQKQARETFDFDVIQAASTLYGRDYFLGDLVTARYGIIERNKKIVAVTVTVQQDREAVSLEVADVP